jgi:hypothetical protein
MSDHPWSNELQAFLDAHSTRAEMLRDLDSLPDSVTREFYIYLTTVEVLGDLEREGYLERIK